MGEIKASRAISMLQTMATMQDEHNTQVHPQWRLQRYEYYRAIWVECAEMLDHFGWKWWKKQDPDLDQVKLELVDIWHFALSELIRAGQLTDAVGIELAGVAAQGSDPTEFREAIEALAAASLTSHSFELRTFVTAMDALPLPYEELFKLYIGKNILNRFRQDHGYKTGEYKKLWQGREDNEHLMEILSELDCAPEALPDELYVALKDRYSNQEVAAR